MEILILHSLKAVKPADGEQQGACRQCEERYGDKRERALKVLQQAQQYYFAMEQFRQQRARNIQYTYGDQWGDIINVDGKAMREDDYIKSEGNIPLKNNLIHRMVKTVVGVFRQQQSEPTCMARDRDEQAQAETMPVTVEGDIQWGVNRAKRGWLVWLMNNKGVIHYANEPEEFDLTKTAEVKVTFKPTGRVYTATVKPGEWKLVKIEE